MIDDAELLINLIIYHENQISDIEYDLEGEYYSDEDVKLRKSWIEMHENWLDLLHRKDKI